jgi:hypothetical protein
MKLKHLKANVFGLLILEGVKVGKSYTWTWRHVSAHPGYLRGVPGYYLQVDFPDRPRFAWVPHNLVDRLESESLYEYMEIEPNVPAQAPPEGIVDERETSGADG